VDPALVDFNIHPAKKEARFRNLAELRQLIIGTLRGLLADFGLRVGAPGRQAPVPVSSQRTASWEWTQAEGTVGVKPGIPAALHPGTKGGVTYRGQLFRLFLLVEHGDSLFIVDQHAAHERLLFEELKRHRLAAQELLLPVRLEGVGEELIRRRADSWGQLGIRVERGEDGVYSVTALPEELLCVEDELAAALAEGSGSPEELEQRVLSLAACRTAVKDGEELDPPAAAELARRALALDNARCPHGRPIWMEIRRGELLRAVARPVGDA